MKPAMDNDRPIPGTRVASYIVVRKIASGGQADIFEARHRITRKRVAIKLLKNPSDAGAVERFQQEAKLALTIKHDNLYSATKFDTYRGIPYMVMPFFQGICLARLIGGGRSLDVDEAVSIACQALTGLQALHDAHVVHRDLKPSNIFIVFRREGELVKLLDLGISKELTEERASQTSSKLPLGTPCYMAPERMRNETTVRSDIYAMGVILYEALTGVRPIEGSPGEVRAKIMGSKIASPPGRLNQGISTELEEIVLKAMSRDPAERYGSATEMKLALETAPLRANADSISRTETADITRSALMAPQVSQQKKTRRPLSGKTWIKPLLLLLVLHGLCFDGAASSEIDWCGVRKNLARSPVHVYAFQSNRPICLYRLETDL